MNNTFPTLEEIQEARSATAPLTVQQMVEKIAVSVRDSIKHNPHSTFVNVKFPEFGPYNCDIDVNFDHMFKRVIYCIPSHYQSDWLWSRRELMFTIRWN